MSLSLSGKIEVLTLSFLWTGHVVRRVQKALTKALCSSCIIHNALACVQWRRRRYVGPRTRTVIYPAKPTTFVIFPRMTDMKPAQSGHIYYMSV